jgi:hypothetical protein
MRAGLREQVRALRAQCDEHKRQMERLKVGWWTHGDGKLMRGGAARRQGASTGLQGCVVTITAAKTYRLRVCVFALSSYSFLLPTQAALFRVLGQREGDGAANRPQAEDAPAPAPAAQRPAVIAAAVAAAPAAAKPPPSSTRLARPAAPQEGRRQPHRRSSSRADDPLERPQQQSARQQPQQQSARQQPQQQSAHQQPRRVERLQDPEQHRQPAALLAELSLSSSSVSSQDESAGAAGARCALAPSGAEIERQVGARMWRAVDSTAQRFSCTIQTRGRVAVPLTLTGMPPRSTRAPVPSCSRCLCFPCPPPAPSAERNSRPHSPWSRPRKSMGQRRATSQPRGVGSGEKGSACGAAG